MFGQCEPAPDLSHDHSPGDAVPVSEQARLFLVQLEASEIVEMHCVHDYLERRLLGAFEEVEDYAVKMPRPRYSDLGDPCADGVEGCPFPFQYGRFSVGEIIEHLTSLGLGYARRILEPKDDEEKVDLMLHGCDVCCYSFIGADSCPRRSVWELGPIMKR